LAVMARVPPALWSCPAPPAVCAHSAVPLLLT
jgi:hypothetical protein